MHVGLVIAREQTEVALQKLRTAAPAGLQQSAVIRRVEDGTVTPKDARELRKLATTDGWDQAAAPMKELAEAVDFQIQMQGPVRTSLEKARDWLAGT